jgi:hypothetical protein
MFRVRHFSSILPSKKNMWSKSGSKRSSFLTSMLARCFQCCGSGMLIPDPGSWFLSISDPGSRIQQQQQKRRGKKFVVLPLLVVTNSQKWKLFCIEQVQQIFALIYKGLVLLTPKIAGRPVISSTDTKKHHKNIMWKL